MWRGRCQFRPRPPNPWLLRQEPSPSAPPATAGAPRAPRCGPALKSGLLKKKGDTVGCTKRKRRWVLRGKEQIESYGARWKEGHHQRMTADCWLWGHRQLKADGPSPSPLPHTLQGHLRVLQAKSAAVWGPHAALAATRITGNATNGPERPQIPISTPSQLTAPAPGCLQPLADGPPRGNCSADRLCNLRSVCLPSSARRHVTPKGEQAALSPVHFLTQHGQEKESRELSASQASAVCHAQEPRRAQGIQPLPQPAASHPPMPRPQPCPSPSPTETPGTQHPLCPDFLVSSRPFRKKPPQLQALERLSS